MAPSRKVKNRMLIATCLALGALLLGRWAAAGLDPGTFFKIWLLALPVVLALNTDKGLARRLDERSKHLLLFFLTGSALGATAAQALRDPGGLGVGRWLWLGLAVVAAVTHYSPNRSDVYTR